jgi:hypothetical protein
MSQRHASSDNFEKLSWPLKKQTNKIQALGEFYYPRQCRPRSKKKKILLAAIHIIHMSVGQTSNLNNSVEFVTDIKKILVGVSGLQVEFFFSSKTETKIS